MKKRSLLYLLYISIASLCAISFYAVSQQQKSGSTNENLLEWPIYFSAPNAYDPITFEVISPDGNQENVAHLNTPDQIEARFIAWWAITDPEDFRAKNPSTPEDPEALALAFFAFENPGIAEEIEATKTPEEKEADRLALESITR